MLKETRIPADAITINYESAIRHGATPEQAIVEVDEDYPNAGIFRIKRVLDYYHSHQPQAQP